MDVISVAGLNRPDLDENGMIVSEHVQVIQNTIPTCRWVITEQKMTYLRDESYLNRLFGKSKTPFSINIVIFAQ